MILLDRKSLIVSAIALCSLISLPTTVWGQETHRSGVVSPNARAYGKSQHLVETSLSLTQRTCASADDCVLLPTNPISLSVTAPFYGPLLFEVTKIKLPTTEVQTSDGRTLDTTLTMPIVFKGRVRLRHTSTGTAWYPTSGTIFRRAGYTQVELVVPRVNRRAKKVRSHFDLIRVPLTKFRVSTSTKLNARLVRSPESKTATCGNHGEIASLKVGAASVKPASSGSNGGKVTTKATRIVNIAVQSDFEYVNKLGEAGAHERIISTIGAADSVYDAQLNVELNLSKISLQTSANQPFASTNSSTLLTQFQSSNNSTNRLGTSDTFLLATGKEIDGNVIGLAFVGVVCNVRSQSYGLYQRQTDARDIATAIHEIGHKFGGQHVQDGGYMSAVLTSTLPTFFSATSIGQIMPYLTANYAGCIGQKVGGVSSFTPTPTPRPTSTPTLVPTPKPTNTPGPPPPPTSTPKPGSGGDNSGGNGSDLAPATLTVELTKSGEVSIDVGFENTGSSQCEVSLYGGITPILARSMAIEIADGDITDGAVEFTGEVKGSAIKKPSTTPVKVHFYARVVCDGVAVADSEVVSVNTKRINVSRPRAGRTLFPVAGWLKRLTGSAEEAT